MSQYVALLRGINVGGHSRVEMSRLKACLEAAGLSSVSTYINSGNVIFTSSKKPAELIELIEQAIKQEFGLQVPVVVRTAVDIADILAKIPASWTNDSQQRTDVMFLWPEVDKPGVLKLFKINPAIERVLQIDGAIVWNIGRANVMRGGGVKLIKSDLYKHMTIRNINTVRKLHELTT